MMNTNELTNGDVVELTNGDACTIIAIERGWIALDNGKKVRAKKIAQILPQDEPEPEPEDEDEDEEGPIRSNLATQIERFRENYSASTGPGGRKSQSNHDAIANALEGLEPEEVMAIAEKLLDLEPGFLMAKYGHLNRGQQRMNTGNRLRSALKNLTITVNNDGKLVKAPV